MTHRVVVFCRRVEDWCARIVLFRRVSDNKPMRHVATRFEVPSSRGANEIGEIPHVPRLLSQNRLDQSRDQLALVEVITMEGRLKDALCKTIDEAEDEERHSEAAEYNATVLGVCSVSWGESADREILTTALKKDLT